MQEAEGKGCGKGRFLYMDVSRCGVRLDILEVQKPCEEIAHTVRA